MENKKKAAAEAVEQGLSSCQYSFYMMITPEARGITQLLCF
jgi:hypothetical protein